MTTATEALTYDHIVALALEHGFKLKPQVDGRMALNDYVIDFARAVYDIGHAADTIDNLRAQLAEAQKDAERWGWVAQCARLDQFGGFVVTPDEPAFASDVSLAFIREIDAAIGAAKGESNG